MITIYRRTEGKVRILFFCIVVFYAIGCVLGLIYRFLDVDTGWWQKIFSVFYLLNAFFLGAIFWIGDKIKLDESNGIITIGDSITKISFAGVKIPIANITAIEVIKSKKTDKIRRFLIRCGPIKFYRVEPARKAQFLAHLSRLATNAHVIEKYGSFF